MKKLLKNITIGVILSLFVIESIFTFKIPFVKANSLRTEINYSDKDYITLEITEKDGKYSLNIESKNLGAVDWIGYVFPLTPTQFESPDNFYEKTKSNRSIYTTEDQPLGIVYAKAKGFFRYLDILSTGVDWAMNKIFGNPFRDTLTIPSTEENIYLIRSYSGGWGKFTDPDEKPFVREKVYKGKERDRQAVVINISLATFDTLGVFIPLADFLGDQLNIIIEAGLRKANEITTAKAMGVEGSKEATKYLFRVAAETGKTSLLKAGEIIGDEATQNFFKFIARSCEIAVKVVDVGSKISNAGQVVDRIGQMVIVATPLETSYLVVGNPLLALEKKETKEKPGLIEEIPEIIEKAGPAALVPKPPEEEKPKEEQKETPEIITSIPSGKIAFVSDRDGNKEIYMLKANSTKAINLTNNSADDWDPVWSPDGSELAFVSDRDGANKIYIMDSNGSNVRGLTEGEDPYWFPDGSRIIFTYLLEGEKFMCGSSIYPRYGLFIINTNGKQKKEQLSLAPSTFEKDDMLKKYNLKDPIISPDGEKIAFSAGNWNCGWQHSIYVINLKGEFLNKYSTIPWKYPGDLFNPSWSPDGVKLIFNSYNGYHGGYCSRGAFFNDEIEFKWGKCNSELTGKWELDQRYDIWEVSEISQDRNKLLKGDYPVWSPSGKKIAFTGKGFNVFFMDNDGHNTKQVTNLGRNWDSDWSQ